jgi:ABC-type transport system involved in multi-copper enzyme maturation permease subunit
MNLKRSVSAELMMLRKRTGAMVLLGLWVILDLVFGYLVPYLTYRNGSGPRREPLSDLLPQNLGNHVASSFPFYGGAFALMLGVLAAGSDYGWGTWKTLFTQRPGRLKVFTSKLIALAVGLLPFVLSVLVVGAAAGVVIGQVEGIAIGWPSASEVLLAFGAGWFLLGVWAAFGVMLAVVSRGTSLAIGVGILYALALEGLLSALASQVSLLEPLVKFFLRANGYSLVRALGVSLQGSANDGPGAFSGPFVGGLQALIVLTLYLGSFLLISAVLIRRRDIA